jgi:putative addiction module component
VAKVREVLNEALKLEPDDRASVAVELLDSLEPESSDKDDVEAAWAVEIERRARRVLQGESLGTEWAEIRGKAEANLTKR